MEPTDAMKAVKGLGSRLEGTVIQGQYLIEKLIQKGGMAWLYKARHKILQEPMAIKILFPQWSDDPLVRVRFIDEAKIQFKLKHPNIVQVTDVIEDDGLLGIVQEWVEGEDLNRCIQRFDGPMPLEEIWGVSAPLLEALDFAHEMGVVHRDIKPSNVLLGRVGQRLTPKLADFGIAKILDELGERTTTGTTLGTMKYIAPEQIRDSKSVDHRADIYGFGIMLYRMATGVYPFSGNIESVMFKQLYEAPPRPSSIHPNISPEFEEVILQCLTKHPEDRFPDCSEVLETMRPIMPRLKKRTTRNNMLFTGVRHQAPLQRDLDDISSPTPSFIQHGHQRTSSAALNATPPLVETSSPRIQTSIEQLREPSFVSHSQSQLPSISRASKPLTSPFSSGGNPPEWGEFMLDVEDDYEDDETPTQRPQPSPYSTGEIVEVKLGKAQTGNLQVAYSMSASETAEPATMLEMAPSLDLFDKIGKEMEERANAMNESSVISSHALSTESVVSNIQNTESEDLPNSVVTAPPEPLNQLPSQDLLTPVPSPARIERTGSFKFQLGDHASPSVDSLHVFEPEDEFAEHDVAASFENLIQVQESVSSENYQRLTEHKKKINPLLLYPLIGIALGAFVLGVSWLILRFGQ